MFIGGNASSIGRQSKYALSNYAFKRRSPALYSTVRDAMAIHYNKLITPPINMFYKTLCDHQLDLCLPLCTRMPYDMGHIYVGWFLYSVTSIIIKTS